MKSFFKIVLASIIGFFIVGILFLFITLGIIGGFVSSLTQEETIIVHPNSILKVSVERNIVEMVSANPMALLSKLNDPSNTEVLLRDVVKSILYAKEDPNISAILLDASYSTGNVGMLEEIRSALAEFRTSGKPIIAYGDFYTQGAYYIASVADKIYMNPQGMIDFKGLTSQSMFFRGTLDKLGIETHVIRNGKYKSAIETFANDKMSKENKEQIGVYLGSVWNNWLNAIAESRQIEVSKINTIADQLLLKDAESTVTYKFVDKLLYRDQLNGWLDTLIGGVSDNGRKMVDMSQYAKILQPSQWGKPTIAVVYAVGEIALENSSNQDNVVNARELSKVLSGLRKDTTVKAVVLRINSPGGSALASELILREVSLLREIKPLIVSFGDVAASGGYYIASGANAIVTQNNTLTGSIGVFGLLFNAQKGLKDKLGITIDGVSTNRYADMGLPFRVPSEAEKQYFSHSVGEIYKTFIGHVSRYRNLTLSQVDSIAQGRIWSGSDAIQLRLADYLGGLEQAIVLAAQMANLQDYQQKYYPLEKDTFTQLMGLLSSGVQSIFSNSYNIEGLTQSFLNKIKQEHKTLQMRIPYDIRIDGE